MRDLRNEPAGISLRIVGMNTSIFMLAFAAWVIFGPSGRFIAQEFGLTAATATLIKTLPILIGSVMRIPVGILADRLGARLVFSAIMFFASACSFGLSYSANSAHLVLGSVMLGMVGTSFAVGVQSVSSWTPKERQGYALGIFGAGNIGTAITTFGLPLLLTTMGWRGAFRVYSAVLAFGGMAYWLGVRNAPRRAGRLTLAGMLEPLRSAAAWRVGFYYMGTFGVFVAATLGLTDLYIDAYDFPVSTAGLLATTFTFTASLARIPGGRLADTYGADAVVRASLSIAGIALLTIGLGMSAAVAVGLAFVAALALGAGMAGTFKYIPELFPASVGAAGGIVGALGGLGGFLLPQASAMVKGVAGSAAAQVIPLGLLALLAAVVHYRATAAAGDLELERSLAD